MGCRSEAGQRRVPGKTSRAALLEALQGEGPELGTWRTVEAPDVIVRFNGSGQRGIVPRPRLVRRHCVAGKALQAVGDVDVQGPAAVGEVRGAVVVVVELQPRSRADFQAVGCRGLTWVEGPEP